LGLEGIEFIEYATSKPQALGQVLEAMGFRPIARHRSREVLLYRQGDINVIVNAHGRGAALTEKPVIAAIALRVQDAVCRLQAGIGPRCLGRASASRSDGAAHSRRAWRGQQPHLLCGPPPRILDLRRGLHARTCSRQEPAGHHGLHFFGVVQYIGNDRSDDWTEFYSALFGFTALEPETRFGILPKGRILQSPCKTFYLQLIEPEPGVLDVEDDELLPARGPGHPDVQATVAALRQRGVDFVPAKTRRKTARARSRRPTMGNAMFELVHHARRLNTMSQFEGKFDDFGMDTITLAGPAEGQARRHEGGRLRPGDAAGP